MKHPVPSPRYSGERVRVRGSSIASFAFDADSFRIGMIRLGSVSMSSSRFYGLRRPLTLTLSPEYRGEGT